MAVDNPYLSDLATADVDVLRECLRVVDERAALVRERGKNTEARAGTTLTFLGVVGAALALLAGSLPESSPGLGVLILGALAIGFLSKASYYGLRAIGTQHAKIVQHHLASSMLKDSVAEALKVEIAWKRWEIDQIERPITTRLFYLQRSQRNATMAVLCLTLAVAAVKVGSVTQWMVFGAIVVLLLGIDWLIERRGIWRKR